MKKNVIKKILAISMVAAVGLGIVGCGSSKEKAKTVDLTNISVDQLTEKAKAEGKLNSAGMPDSWANWEGTWNDLKTKYGIEHVDVDMTSAEEIALFESEKDNATKDIGDIGLATGPIAESKGVTLKYKTSHWDDVPAWAKDDDGDYVGGYYGTMSIITNTKLVKKAPTSFQDIVDGDYVVAVGDVAKSSQSQAAVLSAAMAFGGGEDNLQPGYDFYKKLGEQGRLDKGDLTLARLEKGEIAVAILWDFNSLGYREQITKNNSDMSFEVHIPKDASISSGYATIINAYAKNPYAAALAREYILSDEGQINLAKGFAKPIRSNVKLPDDVKSKLIPDSEYVNSRAIKDTKAWGEKVKTISSDWKEKVAMYAK